MSGCRWEAAAVSGSVSLKQHTHSNLFILLPIHILYVLLFDSRRWTLWLCGGSVSVLGNLEVAVGVGDDVVVSFVQSDLDAVGAYGGGVRVDILEGNTGFIFNPSLPEDLLCEWVVMWLTDGLKNSKHEVIPSHVCGVQEWEHLSL